MKQEEESKKLSKFWIGPVLAGCFLSLGYGVTERFWRSKFTQRSHKELLSTKEESFPGQSLESLRFIHNSKKASVFPDLIQEQSKLDAMRKAEQQAKLEELRKAEENNRFHARNIQKLLDSLHSASGISRKEILSEREVKINSKIPIISKLINELTNP